MFWQNVSRGWTVRARFCRCEASLEMIRPGVTISGSFTLQMNRFFAIVNPAAGGGRSAKLAGPALARLREKGLKVDVIASTSPGHTTQLAQEAYDQGYRRFLAVGGDGTAHEIINGVFAGRQSVRRVALGFLPLGTGNSFLRDFTQDGAEASLQALLEARTHPIDLIRLRHSAGEIY